MNVSGFFPIVDFLHIPGYLVMLCELKVMHGISQPKSIKVKYLLSVVCVNSVPQCDCWTSENTQVKDGRKDVQRITATNNDSLKQDIQRTKDR